jgi:hypothetical protein
LILGRAGKLYSKVSIEKNKLHQISFIGRLKTSTIAVIAAVKLIIKIPFCFLKIAKGNVAYFAKLYAKTAAENMKTTRLRLISSPLFRKVIAERQLIAKAT